MSVEAKHIEAALRSVGGIGGQGWSYATLAKGANEALIQSGITTRQGAAVFLAQCMVESAYFRTTSEYGGSKTSYAPYYGRGFIQVTHKDNYAKFGAWCKSKGLLSDANYFVNNPSRLADEKWAWLGGVWYFVTHRHGLIKLANDGNIDAVGRAVHTGDAWAEWYPNKPFHHTRIAHTRAAYNALLKAGVSAPKAGPIELVSVASGSSGAAVEELQRILKLKADGAFGPATDKAVREFQEKNNLFVDGVVTENVWNALTGKKYIETAPKTPVAPAPVVSEPDPIKEDEIDMASLSDIVNAIEASWSKTMNVPTEGVKRTRNQLLNYAYTRSGKAQRDAAKALAIVREVAKGQSLTESQLDEIEKKIDSVLGSAVDE